MSPRLKTGCPKLIDRALQGGDVVITRYGRPVTELKPIPERARCVSATDLDWLAARRIGRLSAAENTGTLVNGLRDEEER